MHAAVKVLEDVDKRFHSNVKAVCGGRRKEWDSDHNLFTNMLSGNSHNKFTFAFCVNFTRQESFCTPNILLFEMIRNTTDEEVAHRVHIERLWMDSAEEDACSFLHCLQYLTYGAFGERYKQLHSLRDLESYVCDIRNELNLYHLETAFTLLGHCYEMEGDYNEALHNYRQSLCCNETNNAANWHVRRVVRFALTVSRR
ncbi:hypothetical protein DPMN_045927 [Dreissena polymorpha]|uniref:Uncharacterized protein n=1 Tax=Dreissena polymorpha TaxID=45954 RepID=A0A9D4D5T6_DREPO|nr:hypothetical protein DPMN_045927 [Dreissena polymorpha]